MNKKSSAKGSISDSIDLFTAFPIQFPVGSLVKTASLNLSPSIFAMLDFPVPSIPSSVINLPFGILVIYLSHNEKAYPKLHDIIKFWNHFRKSDHRLFVNYFSQHCIYP